MATTYAATPKEDQIIMLGLGTFISFLLDEIPREEDAAGRGMPMAVVVHKNNTQPGEGFFKLAARLSRNTSCRTTFWIEEFNFVHRAWMQEPVGYGSLQPVHAVA